MTSSDKLHAKSAKTLAKAVRTNNLSLVSKANAQAEKAEKKRGH